MASDSIQVLDSVRVTKAGQQGLSLEVGGAWNCSSRRYIKVDTHSKNAIGPCASFVCQGTFYDSPYPFNMKLTDVVQPALLLLDEPSNHSLY